MIPRRSHSQGERGFVALTSTIIIAAVLIILMYSTSVGGFYSRTDALGSEFKRVSFGLSEACSNAALLKIAQNYSYQPPVGGEVVTVGPDTCVIRSVAYSAEDPVTHRKIATITTGAQYPILGGSWSSTKITAQIVNPQASVTAPPPTCVIQASPASVQAGKPVTVQWSASSNAVSFTLTPVPAPVVNSPAEAQSGIRTYTAAGLGVVTYTGVAMNSTGGSSQPCTATVTVTSPPPAPSCANTVLMLDRTLTMRNDTAAFQAQRDAARAFLDQYITAVPALNPLPYTGVGSFRGTDGSNALIPTGGRLMNTNNYNTLYTTIDSIYTSNSNSIGTDLGAAISKARSELLSGGLATAKKVLVFMSDGDLLGAEPNGNNSMTDWLNAADAAKLAGIQIFTVAYSADPAGMTRLAQLASGVTPYPGGDTGLLSPNANSHSGSDSGVAWTNPQNAYGSGIATTVNHSNGQQRYSFNTIPVISAGSVINDVVIVANALIADPVVNTGLKGPTFDAADTGGDGNGFEGSPANAYADGSGVASNIDGQNDRHRYWGYNFGLPAGAVIKGIEVRPDWYLDSTSGTNSMGIELSWDAGVTWTASRSESTESTADTNGKIVGAANDTWGHTWSVADLDPAKFRVRLKSSSMTSTRDFYLDWVPVRISYVTPSTSCQLGVDLSWNAGNSWTSEQISTLTSSAASYTFNNAGGWGRTWVPGDLTNANFRARVHAIDPGVTCADTATTNLDTLQVRILYGSTHQPGSANDQGGNAVLENAAADGDNFFIAPTAADMANIFKIVGQKVCPALAPACSNTIDDDGDGLTDAADPSCHVGDVLPGAYDPNDNDEWTPPPIPPAPTPPPPPPPVSIGGWDEVITTGP